ncbi:MAG: Na+/H+ antiporter NhaA [Chitinophagaceae bacterium]|nr:MAG: Na+/H+ antiporter NhaA [Chitinophagaceae bacterium]
MGGENKIEQSFPPNHSTRLMQSVDADDHVLGNPEAPITLVEYGSYFSSSCHAAHEVITRLREHFGDELRYVYRHLPLPGHSRAKQAAIMAEYAAEISGDFWEVHEALMNRESKGEVNIEKVAEDFGLPLPDKLDNLKMKNARRRVEDDMQGAQESGALLAPTFYINDRLYEGAWDESSLSEVMRGSPGSRVKTAALDFVRWGPSAGIALMVMVIIALVLANSNSYGAQFLGFWNKSFGFHAGAFSFDLPLIRWINDGLLTIFFLVVGLEVKREFTVGRLTKMRAAALPLAGSFGGVVVPALLYLLIVPFGPLSIGWGTTISTDTAFAIAIIAFMGNRVPMELRVFLTVCAIVDDLVSIMVVAIFYTDDINITYLAAAGAVTGVLTIMNRWRFYRLLPYIILGLILWFFLHEAGIHATLAGVILALCIPTRPPVNFKVLNAQIQRIFKAETYFGAERLQKHGPSKHSIGMLNTLHDRLESPASKVLHTIEPWSTYFVLPVFALANAGVIITLDVFHTDLPLMMAIFIGLVVGKPVGIYLFSWLAVRFNIAEKPLSYNWRQLFGAGALAGIGFTMSLFIASEAFPVPSHFTAAKIAIFIASTVAGVMGAIILWKRILNPEPLPS